MPGASSLIWKTLTDGLTEALGTAGALDPAKAPRIELAIPRERAHGDWTTNLALLAAKPLGLKPRALAERLAAGFPRDPRQFESIEVAGPGFLNFRYAREFLDALPGRMLEDGERFGASEFGAGQRIQVEYVSANPTGPLNVVSACCASPDTTRKASSTSTTPAIRSTCWARRWRPASPSASAGR
jgi:arginyl-tRNA synthetase